MASIRSPEMPRRAFMAVIAGGLLAAPLGPEAQSVGQMPRIGWLSPGVDARAATGEESRRGRRDLGYVNGQNVRLAYRFAAGQHDRLPELAAQLVRLNVDLIVTTGTAATTAARDTTSSIPIVAVSGDPVGSGFAASLARPGSSITGLAILSPELSAKWLELVREIVPRAARVAVLAFREDGGPQLPVLERAARQLGLQATVITLREPEEIDDRAFEAAIRARSEALVTLSSPVFATHRRRIVDLAARHRLPGVYESRQFVDAGGLVSYGPDLRIVFYRAATYVHRVLRGAKPALLAIEQPTKFELLINLKPAKALGLTIPASLLQRADQVIE